MSNLPIHIKRKQASAPLSPELHEEYKIRSIHVREGDTVTISRGNFAGVEGKVTKVNYKKVSLNIDGVTREKTDGTAIPIPIHPSKVIVKTLNLDDKRRKEILQRRSPVKTSKKSEAPKRTPKTRRKKTEEKLKIEAKE